MRVAAKLSGRAWRTASAVIARATVMTLLGIGLFLLSPGTMAWVNAQGTTDEVNAALERLDALNAAMEDVRDAIDRTSFDLDELSLELAFEDAETILEYVKARVAFQPYAGVLRGAEGALRSAGGNAFDQSLLLATLLADAGYETRIQVSTLTPDQAQELVAGAFVPLANAGTGLEEALIALDEVAELASDPDGVRRTAEDDPSQGADLALFDEVVDKLVAALGPDLLGSGAAAEIEAILEEARQYAYVEYRFSDSEPWTAAHPAWRIGEPPSQTEVVETIEDVMPEKYQHRIRFEAFIERRIGSTLEVKPLMSAYERPVANASDHAFSFGVLPLNGDALAEALRNPLGLEPLAFDLSSSLSGSEFYVPIFDGLPAPGAIAFDEMGNAAPLDAAANPAAGTFKNVARGFGQAAGALSALGGGEEDLEQLALSGYWLQTTLISPGGEERVERRYLVDRIGGERRANGETSPREPLELHDLLTSVTWSVHSGRVNQAWLTDLTLQRLVDARPLMQSLVTDIVSGGEVPVDQAAAQLAASESDWASLSLLEHASVVSSFDERVDTTDGTVSFRPGPVVLAIERGYGSVDGVAGSVARLGLDIQANPRRSVRKGADGSFEVEAMTTLRSGVWETLGERNYALNAAEAAGLLSVGSAVDSLVAKGSAPALVTDRNGLTSLGSAISEGQAAAIERAIDRGFVAVVPTANDEALMGGWWRVDPVTGETLGIGTGGRGQALVQMLTNLGLSIKTATVAARIVHLMVLYTTCISIGTGFRGGSTPTVPVRSCAVPLIGIAVGGPSATGVAIYFVVMYLSVAFDIVGFSDASL